MTAKETFVQKSMEKLEISREEALALWDFDHDGEAPVEVLTIEEKLAKKASSPINKVKNLKAKKKVDEQKTTIIAEILQFLEKGMIDNDESAIIAPEQVGTGKWVFRDQEGSFYTLALTKNKTKPDGYKGA